MSDLAIHDAFQFGQPPKKTDHRSNPNKYQEPPSKQQINIPPPPPKEQQHDQSPVQGDTGRYPSDASNSHYPIKIRCQKCRAVSITRMSSQLGPAAWVWCVLLSPFACLGISCLCIESCRDKVHFCNRCGAIVGKKHAKVC